MLKVKSSVPVFTDTSFKQYTGKRLRPNSIWHYFAIYHRQGKTFYNLGGPQWIEGKVTLIKKTYNFVSLFLLFKPIPVITYYMDTILTFVFTSIFNFFSFCWSFYLELIIFVFLNQGLKLNYVTFRQI